MLGIDIGRVLGAVLVFLLFVALRRALTRLVLRRLDRWAKKTSFPLDDAAVQAVDAPLRFVPVIVGAFFAFEILQLSGNFEDLGYRVIRSLVAFVMFWGSTISPSLSA